MTFAGQIEFFPKIVEALGIPPCHLLGPDVGMPVALLYALTYPQSLDLLSPQLKNLEIPVQIFWGDLDQFLLADNALELDQVLKHSQVKIFKNCGHLSYQNQSVAFTEMVKDWLTSGYKRHLNEA